MNIDGALEYIRFLQSRLDTIPEVVEWKVHDHGDVLIELVQAQLLLGRDGDGDVLKPGYTEDPFFESAKDAEAYKRRKIFLESEHRQRIRIPLNYPDKDSNTPNLIVRGDFQDQMYITTTPDTFTISSHYEASDDIEAKYNKPMSLAPLSKEYFWLNYLMPAILSHLKLKR